MGKSMAQVKALKKKKKKASKWSLSWDYFVTDSNLMVKRKLNMLKLLCINVALI